MKHRNIINKIDKLIFIYFIFINITGCLIILYTSYGSIPEDTAVIILFILILIFFILILLIEIIKEKFKNKYK